MDTPAGVDVALPMPGTDPFNGGIVVNLILLRHGESEWNRENRFTGWTDVDLSEQGI